MDCRFVFVGNRRFVLEEMVEQGLNIVEAIIVSGTHLERDFLAGKIPITNVMVSIIENKQELLEIVNRGEFEVLVSNGCPYILPIAELPEARYVNIHPSYLPDLRGVDPVIGAILYGRDAGATCHIMDSGIDTGAIISQVRIPFSDDLDVTTLYQLSFIAEKESFKRALARDFAEQYNQQNEGNFIYYNRSPEDRVITFRESNDILLRKIKAFNNRSQGCEFFHNGDRFLVYSATRMENTFLLNFLNRYKDGVIAFSYEGNIIFRKDGEALRFMEVIPENNKPLACGDKLF